MRGLGVILWLLAGGIGAGAAAAGSMDGIRAMLPHSVDSRLILQRIERYVPDLPVSENAVWDLSGHSPIGDEVEADTHWTTDTTLSVTVPHIRRDYLLRGDTLRLITRETAFVRLADSVGSPELFLPLVRGASISEASVVKGRAYQSDPIGFPVSTAIECLGKGTLVLPDRRAYPDVSLMRLTRISPSDTLTAYSWVSPLCRYPLARTSDSSAASAAVTWICDPTKQAPSAIVETSFNIQDSFDGTAPHSESNGFHNPPFEVSVTEGLVSVSFRDTARQDAAHDGERFTLILSDSQGRAFTSASGVFAGGYATLSLAGVPRGEYILYINATGITATEKIITR